MNAPRLSVGRGANRRITKAGLASGERFKAAVEAALVELGAKRSPEAPASNVCTTCGELLKCNCDGGPVVFPPYAERRREWSIETRHGKLWLNVYAEDCWIAGLWEDWPRAKAAGMDHWKWNHHYHLGAGEAEAADFVRRVRAVLPTT